MKNNSKGSEKVGKGWSEKKNCQENHWQCLEEGAKREIKTALALQVPSSLRTPHGENEKHINDVRKAKIKAVHE